MNKMFNAMTTIVPRRDSSKLARRMNTRTTVNVFSEGFAELTMRYSVMPLAETIDR
jgi:hypothetical protein